MTPPRRATAGRRSMSPRTWRFRTKPQIAAALIRMVAVLGVVALDWITADEAYGTNGEFLDELERLEQRYVVEVPKSTTVWTVDPANGLPIREVIILVNGRPAQAKDVGPAPGEVNARETTLEREVELAQGQANQISVVASNSASSSRPVTISVVNEADAGGAIRTRPKLYLLAVGISDYAKSDLTLRYPHRDAEDFAAAWKHRGGGRLREGRGQSPGQQGGDRTRDPRRDGVARQQLDGQGRRDPVHLGARLPRRTTEIIQPSAKVLETPDLLQRSAKELKLPEKSSHLQRLVLSAFERG